MNEAMTTYTAQMQRSLEEPNSSFDDLARADVVSPDFAAFLRGLGRASSLSEFVDRYRRVYGVDRMYAVNPETRLDILYDSLDPWVSEFVRSRTKGFHFVPEGVLVPLPKQWGCSPNGCMTTQGIFDQMAALARNPEPRDVPVKIQHAMLSSAYSDADTTFLEIVGNTVYEQAAEPIYSAARAHELFDLLTLGGVHALRLALEAKAGIGRERWVAARQLKLDLDQLTGEIQVLEGTTR